MRLIDADALIDGYKHMGYDPSEHPEESYMEGWCKGFNSAVDHCVHHAIHAPTIEPEPHWIPCSKRLPEARTEVIVSCTDDSGDTKFRYMSSGWVTTNKEYWIVDNEINNFVVAWMPLLEPYKGEQP